MSYIKNPHSDEPFSDPESAAYTADRKARLVAGSGKAIGPTADGFPVGDPKRVIPMRPSLVEQLQETITAQASSIASQSRLIAEMSQDAIRGRKAADAMMLLGVKMGINPVPTDPEEFAAAILAVLDKISSKQEV